MKKRVDLIDNILCGFVAYALLFMIYLGVGFKLDASWKFWTVLALALAVHGGLIKHHPGTYYSSK